MINRKHIIDILKNEVTNGTRDFIIYPFGENGQRVKQILSECFGIKQCIICDKELCKYNAGIITYEEMFAYLKDNISSRVLLTIEDKNTNKELYDSLCLEISEEQIINFISLDTDEDTTNKDISILSEHEQIRRNIKPSYLFPIALPTKQGTNKTIKVRFFYVANNILEPLVRECVRRGNYDIEIISLERLHKVGEINSISEFCNKWNVRSTAIEDYSPRHDRPDVVFVFNPYVTKKAFLGDIKSYAKLVICLSAQLIQSAQTIDEFWNLFHGGFECFEPDYYLFDRLIYKDISKSQYMNEKIVELGNPKFDSIHDALRGDIKYPNDWEKLLNKKVVVYTTDHDYSESGVSNNVTFDVYAKTIFEWALNNQNVGIVFRPHINMLRELLLCKYWSEDDLEEFKEQCRNSENIVYDDTPDYNYAFSIADGIITDAYCGIICSALPTLKPICVLYRDENSQPIHSDLVENYYMAFKKDEVISFLNMVRDGTDKMIVDRENAMKNYIKHFDGKNGQRTIDFIEQKLNELNRKL